MKKKLLLSILVIGVSITTFKFLPKIDSNSDTNEYLEKVKAHPFYKRKTMSKAERKSNRLPPNAYFEQEYLNEINPKTGRTHPENLEEIRKNIDNYRSKSPGLIDNQWQERGPNNIGGRTRVVFFDPNDNTNRRVFAGGVSGGLWVTNDITDENTPWVQIGIPENLAITCYAIDPQNPQIMYLGTGESYTSDNGAGNGVWKSVDGGATWNNVFEDTSNDIELGIFFINDILAWVNPNTNNTEIFIGVAGAFYRSSSQFLGSDKQGVYKTDNGGNSWTKLRLKNSSNTDYEINDFEIAADNSIWMGAARNIFGHGGGDILRSTDGNLFDVVYNVPGARRTELAVSKSDSNKVFVLVDGGAFDPVTETSPPITMIKTDDSFATVSNMALPNDADNGIPANDFTRGQAFYDLVIEVDPNNDDILYVGGIDAFRSTDAGDSWIQISKWSENNNLRFLNVPRVHADQHALTFHPTDSNMALLGTDGGVYYATSLSGAEPALLPDNESIVPRKLGYNTLQFYNGDIGQDARNDVLLAGAQDNGTQFIESADNSSQNNSVDVFGGDGAFSFLDVEDDYLIASFVYNVKARLNLPFNGNGVQLDNDQSTGSFINPQELDRNLDVLFANASARNGSFDSINRYIGIKEGETLITDRIGDPSLNAETTAFKVSPFNSASSTLYVGTQSGRVIRVDGANTSNRTWTIISGGINLFSGGSVSSINFGEIEQEIMVTFHNYGIENIWYTPDGGTTWESKDGDLPDLPVKAILMSPFDKDEVIIGTELGIWRTENFTSSSPNWVQSQNGMSNVKVTSLELRTQDNTVLASTYGRGMFTGKFLDNTASLEEVLTDKSIFTIYPTVSNGTFTLFAKNEVGKSQIDIFDISGKKVYNTNVDFSQDRKQKVSTNLAVGMYIVNLVNEQNKKTSRKIIIE